MLNQHSYQSYLNILKRELVPALGCTEPIAIALAEIKDAHTNLVRLERDGERLFYREPEDAQDADQSGLDGLNLADILEFANTASLDDVRPILERQVRCNLRIAREGITHTYGGRVGATLMRHYANDVRVRARAMAANGMRETDTEILHIMIE